MKTRKNPGCIPKFVVAVKKDGEYEIVSSPRYITNPEALADYSEPFPEAESIKGTALWIRRSWALPELDDLGGEACGLQYSGFQAVRAEYGQKDIRQLLIHITVRDYIFNGHVVSEYDYVFRTLTEKGIIITAILLNNKSDAYPQLIHPAFPGRQRLLLCI